MYYPDFVVAIGEGERLIIETKGLEDVEVEHKDNRIEQWCKDATGLSGSMWSFIRVNQEEFGNFKSIQELSASKLHEW